MRRIIAKLREQKGSALVIIALSLTALVGSLALVTDAGLLFYNKVQLTNATDAAALGGAQLLPEEPALAASVAYALAEKNGVPIDQVSVVITENQRGIRVRATRDVDHTFARVLGFTVTDIESTSVAEVANANAVKGIVPLSIEEQELYYGEDYVLKYGAGASPGGAYHSGWLGPLRLGGSGASTYRENLVNGYQGTVSIGDIIDVETGNMSGPTTDGIEERISQCTHSPACTYDDYRRDCPRVVLVPVIRPYDSGSVRVVGFAAFFLDYVGGSGNDNYVWGKFVRMYYNGSLSSDPSADFGLRGIRLIS